MTQPDTGCRHGETRQVGRARVVQSCGQAPSEWRTFQSGRRLEGVIASRRCWIAQRHRLDTVFALLLRGGFDDDAVERGVGSDREVLHGSMRALLEKSCAVSACS